MFFFKLIITFILFVVIYNLFSALRFMVKGYASVSVKLQQRLIYSVAVMILVFAAVSSGFLKLNPNPVFAKLYKQK